jgi:hypothetical protein
MEDAWAYRVGMRPCQKDASCSKMAASGDLGSVGRAGQRTNISRKKIIFQRASAEDSCGG